MFTHNVGQIIFTPILGRPLADWLPFGTNETQLVIRTVENKIQTTEESLRFPDPSRRALAHWDALASDSGNRYFSLCLVILSAVML